VPLPGGSSRLDYASVDSGRNRLYVAHLGGGLVIIFDTQRRRVVKTIAAPGAHGVLAVPSLGRVYASATDERRLLTIDERTNKVIASAPAGEYPDGIAYDPADRRVYVSDESGGAELVFTAAGRSLTSIPLSGEAGNVQYDPVSGRVLADVQTRNEVAVISTRTNRVIRRVALPGCNHDHGLLVDAPRRLAFVACDGNARLLTLDLRSMKVTGNASIGGSPDVLAFDTSLRRLYVSAESGVVAVFGERGRGLKKLGQDLLAPAAHVVAVDSTTHLVYFPLQNGPRLLIMKPTR
jgi:DNA-binding beta-propeller fold protein YncE